MSAGVHFAAQTVSPATPLSTVGERTKHAWTPQTRNPVSARLYKILRTNFNDDATREALRTLSELYANEPAVSERASLGARRGVEDANDDDVEEDADAVFGRTTDHPAFEAFPGEAAAKARKNLRRDMELKLADGSRQFLKALGDVDQVRRELNSM